MGKDDMIIHPRTVKASNEMTVSEMLQKGNAMQKKIACVFDANGDGVYDTQEAKLFNATTASEDKNGNITLWTNFSSGKKVSNKVSKQNLDITRLYLNKDSKGNERVLRNTMKNDYYGFEEREADGKYKLTLGESEYSNGYYVVRGNTTKYYTEKGKLTGSTERKNGREYYKDSNGKTLYSIERHESYCSEYDDEDYYDNKGVLRYSIHYTDREKLSLTKYDEKARVIKKYNDSFALAEACWNPHDMFESLSKIVESSYHMPEDE